MSHDYTLTLDQVLKCQPTQVTLEEVVQSYDKFEAALPAFPELVTLKEIVSAEQRPITLEELIECNEVQHVTRREAVKPNLRAENPVAETSQPEPIPRFQLDKPSEDEVIKQRKRTPENISMWGAFSP